ncbi:MAG: antibiotic biosynthesis monooxygenase [Actinomycetota bacterium]|nr:antibiotic biosynthesis monooxygenase [Actinomycetota bacterium]
MLVVTRYRIPAQEADSFAATADTALAVLAQRPGFVDGALGRNVDDPLLWTLTTRWRDTGSYRRALSSFEVKAVAVPLLSRAIDEPTAYEVAVAR